MTSPYVEYEYADGTANTVRPTRVRYPNGRTLDYAYGVSGSDDDLLSRVSQLKDGSTVLAQYDYLGSASFARCDYAEPQIRWDLSPSGNSFSGLDSLDRTTTCLWRKYAPSASDPVQIDYAYDRAGNRTSRSVVGATGNDELYRYDGLNRLTDRDRGDLASQKITAPEAAEQWRLDATGNWSRYENLDFVAPNNSLDQDRTTNRANEITGFTSTVGASWAQPTYDRAGNMTVFPQPATPIGSYAATYDAWNRLVAVSGGNAYAYDPLNRRTVRTAGGVARHYYYSTQWQVVEERLGDSPDSAPAERQFVWGLRYLDDLVLRDRSPTNDGALSERLYALQDANWNVVAVTDAAGDVQERYRYSAYGTPTFLNPDYSTKASSDCDWETLYAGYRFDAETGLYQVRWRWLNSTVGAWGTRDPIGLVMSTDYYRQNFDNGSEHAQIADTSATTSLYMYSNGRPLSESDPFGLEADSFDPIGKCTTCQCSYGDEVDRIRRLPCKASANFRKSYTAKCEATCGASQAPEKSGFGKCCKETKCEKGVTLLCLDVWFEAQPQRWVRLITWINVSYYNSCLFVGIKSIPLPDKYRISEPGKIIPNET